MIIKLDMNSETPLYEQLYNSVVLGIATGRLKEGEKMPTVRKLGIDLGINLHTVNKAYTLLKQKGYLSANRNMGAVVNSKRYYEADEVFISAVKASVKPVLAECCARGMNKKEINKMTDDLIDEILNETEDIT